MAPGVTYGIRVRQGDATCGSPPRTDGAPPPGGAVALASVSIGGAAPVSTQLLFRMINESCGLG